MSILSDYEYDDRECHKTSDGANGCAHNLSFGSCSTFLA